jgi:NADH:ubiquinone oxidoreductase subunit 2 (subunit N)
MAFLIIFVFTKNKKMYAFLQKFHSGLAYLALLLLVVAVIVSALGLFSNKEFTKGNRTIALFGLIGVHVQLLIGLLVYFVSPLGMQSIGNMKDSAIRLTSLEHPLINIIAIVLITIGWSKHKKTEVSKAKFKSIALFYGLGLLLILSRLPWASWLA